jgi:predicted O-methyltransferase YrrM
MKRAAHRAVEGCGNGRVVWIEEFSFDAARNWRDQIDFLFIDGDHSEAGVQRDWDDWNRFVIPGGVVAFHDARTFPGGWPQPDWGPVRVVDKLFRAGKVCDWQVVQEVDSLMVVERV